MIQVAESVR